MHPPISHNKWFSSMNLIFSITHEIHLSIVLSLPTSYLVQHHYHESKFLWVTHQISFWVACHKNFDSNPSILPSPSSLLSPPLFYLPFSSSLSHFHSFSCFCHLCDHCFQCLVVMSIIPIGGLVSSPYLLSSSPLVPCCFSCHGLL